MRFKLEVYSFELDDEVTKLKGANTEFSETFLDTNNHNGPVGQYLEFLCWIGSQERSKNDSLKKS